MLVYWGNALRIAREFNGNTMGIARAYYWKFCGSTLGRRYENISWESSWSITGTVWEHVANTLGALWKQHENTLGKPGAYYGNLREYYGNRTITHQ